VEVGMTRFRTRDYKLPQPLIIKIEEKSSKSTIPLWAEIVVALCTLLLTASLLMWLVFSAYSYKSVSTPLRSPFSAKVTLDINLKATVRDPLPIVVTLMNTGQSHISLNLTLVTTSNKDITLAKDGSTMVKIDNLPPGGTFTHTFDVILLNAPADGVLEFVINLDNGVTNQSVQLSDAAWQMGVWSWPPHSRTLINYVLASSGLISGILAIFSEKLKKALNL
jgi:hypothetical protein